MNAVNQNAFIRARFSSVRGKMRGRGNITRYTPLASIFSKSGWNYRASREMHETIRYIASPSLSLSLSLSYSLDTTKFRTGSIPSSHNLSVPRRELPWRFEEGKDVARRDVPSGVPLDDISFSRTLVATVHTACK